MKTTTHSQRGFTLIEMMVVLIIIGIIGMLVVPNLLERPDKARATVARADIQAISNALEFYKLDNFFYPTTEQGLAALVTKPSQAPIPTNWSAGGYLKKLPNDPWGNPYHYMQPGQHGAFDVMSYGADGKEGGEDKNADIGNWE